MESRYKFIFIYKPLSNKKYNFKNMEIDRLELLKKILNIYLEIQIKLFIEFFKNYFKKYWNVDQIIIFYRFNNGTYKKTTTRITSWDNMISRLNYFLKTECFSEVHLTVILNNKIF